MRPRRRSSSSSKVIVRNHEDDLQTFSDRMYDVLCVYVTGMMVPGSGGLSVDVMDCLDRFLGCRPEEKKQWCCSGNRDTEQQLSAFGNDGGAEL